MQDANSVPYERIKTWHPVKFRYSGDTYHELITWLERTPGGTYWLGGYSVWFEQADDAFQFALLWS
jgi:hypothetical protein